jgi:hypothetical protein
VTFERLALKVVMQNDRRIVVVIMLYTLCALLPCRGYRVVSCKHNSFGYRLPWLVGCDVIFQLASLTGYMVTGL